MTGVLMLLAGLFYLVTSILDIQFYYEMLVVELVEILLFVTLWIVQSIERWP